VPFIVKRAFLNRRTAVSEVKWPLHGRFGSETAKNLTAIDLTDIPQRTQVSVRVYCTGNGNVSAVAVGKIQRLYSGVRIFTGNYPSFL
jgi:hypothetical protein